MLPPADAEQLSLRDVPGGVELHVKAIPGAARTCIQGVLGGALKVRVAAPPEDGQANAALVRFIATLLGLRRTSVVVMSGCTSRDKVLRVAGLDAAALRRGLSAR